ncbi:MAG: GNAT family N-acetyltransferase [Clostridia bacterium]|nr:GNAT family N-acetyltransferase [Clostridia bacterium]
MQLKMWRPADMPIPDYTVPEGFSIRVMRDGEQAMWSYSCLGEFNVEEVTEAPYQRTMGDFPIDHVYFVCNKDDHPVATASCQVKEGGLPFLHYIAVNPDYRGCKLAKPLITAVLKRHVEEDRYGCFLTTDDRRLPAIKTYLTMGYRPVLWSDDARERWETALKNVGIESVPAYNPDMTPAEDILAAK